MAYECKGPDCPNFQTAIQEIADTTTTGDGSPYFDAVKDAEELTPVARDICQAAASYLERLVSFGNDNCAFLMDREFQAEPGKLVDAIVRRNA